MKQLTRTDRNQRMLGFLRQQCVGVLATVDPNGDPGAAVIYYSIDPSFTVTFLTKRGTKKRDNLAHHNHAILVVFDTESQTTAQIKGIAKEITDPDEISRVFRSSLRASLRTSSSGIPPIAKLSAGDFTAYELKPVEVRMAVYSRPDAGSYERVFEWADLP